MELSPFSLKDVKPFVNFEYLDFCLYFVFLSVRTERLGGQHSLNPRGPSPLNSGLPPLLNIQPITPFHSGLSTFTSSVPHQSPSPPGKTKTSASTVPVFLTSFAVWLRKTAVSHQAKVGLSEVAF